MAENTDVSILFEKQSVSEIENVERQIRGDIEKKKQDLRVMVGDRYRDLINAADTIQDMKEITQEVFNDFKIISDMCGSFGRSKSKENILPVKKTNKVNEEEAFYALATQMDLLVDTPEKIWSALDLHQFLTAAQFYLISQHIVNSSLNINASQLKKGSQRDIFKSFPILHHQWAAISHFKPSILKGSRTALKDSTLPDQSVAESLCSIVLLEDYSPRQVFSEFLLARKTSFQDVFHPSFHATSVKKQVEDITHMLRLTIEQIVTLFYTDENKAGSQKPLFYKSLLEITDEKLVKKGKLFSDLFDDEVDVLTVSRYLPQVVTGFVPKLRSIPVSISVSYIQKHAVEWLNGCKEDIHQGIKGPLSFIGNIKGLALIRDAVYELLKVSTYENKTEEDSEDISKLSWNDLCQICLNRSFSIWDELFRPLFFERAKEILEARCSKCFDNVRISLHSTLDELKEGNNGMSDTCWDHDYADFVWHEFPQDFQSNVQDSMLPLKVNGCTPSTKRLCDDFNNILKAILDDVQHFISDEKSIEVDGAEARMKNIRRDVQKFLSDQDDVFDEASEPFQRFSDDNAVRELLNTTFNVGVDNLCTHISSILMETKKTLENTNLKDSIEVNMLLDKAVYLSRFCVSIPEICENIRKITEVDEKLPKQPMKRQLSSHTKDSLYKAMKKTSSLSLQRIYKLFREQGDIAVSIWSEWLTNMVSNLVKNTLQSHDQHFVFSTTNWDEVTIDEEGVKSSIFVPSHPSFYLSSLLYRLAEEFHRVGGGMFERATVQMLSIDIGNAIQEAHESCMEQLKNTRTFQNKIFQIIFDLKFTCNLLCGNTDQKEQDVVSFRQRCKKFIASLEQLVDPFDLDVFMPHIDKFVHKQINKSALIYGCISNVDKHNIHPRRSTTSNEIANIVPLIANPPRFMLLPISSHTKNNTTNTMEPFVGFDSTTRPLYQHQSQVSLTGVV